MSNSWILGLIILYLIPLIGFHFLKMKLKNKCKRYGIELEPVVGIYNTFQSTIFTLIPATNYIPFIILMRDYRSIINKIESELNRTPSWIETFSSTLRNSSMTQPLPEPNNLQGYLTVRIENGNRIVSEQHLQTGSSNGFVLQNPPQVNTSGHNVLDEINRL